MIYLAEVLLAVNPEQVIGFSDSTVAGIACHPSQVSADRFLFVCMNEYLEYNRWQTWRTHLEKLAALNLAGVITPEPIEGLEVPQLIVDDPRKALGVASRVIEGYPDVRLRLFGVTGTNGKTTTTRIISHILTRLGESCGSIGTLGIALPGKMDEAGTYTTPLSPQIYEGLSELHRNGARAVAMEVSSHALALDRVTGLTFDGAILTNIERDHIDFHGTVEAYAEAKRRLFAKVKSDGWCLFNKACPYTTSFSLNASGNILSFGMEGSGADYEAHGLQLEPQGSAFTVRHKDESVRFASTLAGAFQVENAMGAIALVHARGYPLREIADAFRDFQPVTGRMEQIPMPNGCTAIVDYAHNPGGLEHLLEACRPFCKGRLHVVFGCGGDRDKGKRPIMGEIAGRLADVCWVTSDNPRTEDPEIIIDEILGGMAAYSGIEREVDREAAIRKAYGATQADDVLVVAGKGHEDYQIIGHTKHDFSDQAVLRTI